MLVVKAGISKLLVRVANREDPNQAAFSDVKNETKPKKTTTPPVFFLVSMKNYTACKVLSDCFWCV